MSAQSKSAHFVLLRVRRLVSVCMVALQLAQAMPFFFSVLYVTVIVIVNALV